jgi:uncharacterized protein (DUF1800 family)
MNLNEPPGPAGPLGAAVSRRVLIGGSLSAVAALHLEGLVAPRAALAAEPDAYHLDTSTRAGRELHLLRRATAGPTEREAAELAVVGRSRWLLEGQLGRIGPLIDDSAFISYAKRYGDQSMPIVQRKALHETNQAQEWLSIYSVMAEHLARLLFSRRQVHAVVTDFWANHLNVPAEAAGVAASRPHYQHTIRTHALGEFATLLRATVVHPAMLTYLDGSSNLNTSPNENLGRELLELHTVGVGHHSEEDVVNTARALTGVSVDWRTGEYTYNPRHHWVGRLRVLDWESANQDPHEGPQVVASLLDHLARLPETAHYVCRKLAQRFVVDDPSDSHVDELAGIYLTNNTAIRPVLQRLFLGAEFSQHVGQMVRRPADHLIAAIRALGFVAEPSGTAGVDALWDSLKRLGHLPLNCPTPDGYPATPDGWWTTQQFTHAWHESVALAQANSSIADRLGHEDGSPRAHMIKGADAATYGALVDAIVSRIAGQPPTAARRAALVSFLEVDAGDQVVAGASAATWKLEWMIGLLLMTPYHFNY